MLGFIICVIYWLCFIVVWFVEELVWLFLFLFGSGVGLWLIIWIVVIVINWWGVLFENIEKSCDCIVGLVLLIGLVV